MINKPQDYILETITPMYIGSDKVMSPYSDYVYDEETEKIHYINQELLLSELQKSNISEKEVDKIIANIFRYASSNKTEKKYILSKLIKDKNIDLEIITQSIVECFVSPRATQIKRFISSGNRIYIPGSSIKGAIRTAVIYDFYKNTDEGKKYLEKEFPELLNNYKSLEQKQKNLKYKSEEWKSINYKIGIVKKKLENLLNPFGSNAQQDFFKYIQISDTNLLKPDDCIFIDEIKRIKKKTNNKDGISIFVEQIKTERKFNFTIKHQVFEGIDLLSNIYNHDYFKNFTIEKLFEAVNQFSKDQIEFALKKLPVNDYLKNVKEDYDFLLEEIKNGKIIIRIGGYKTFFFNTIASILSKENLKEFRQIFGLGENPKTKEMSKGNFPVTQAFLFDEEEAIELGWCYIYKTEEK